METVPGNGNFNSVYPFKLMTCWPNTCIPTVSLSLNASANFNQNEMLYSTPSWVREGGGLLQLKEFNLISSFLEENSCSKLPGITPAEVKAAFSMINTPWKPLLRERTAWLQDLRPVYHPPPTPPPPPLSFSSFTLDKQNIACYSRHILPVAITSMGASAPRMVGCWVPPIGTGYWLLLPTMSVECKCLFKKLCSSIDFISFSLLLARLLLAQVKCLSIMRFSRWSQACCLSHKSRYYSIM